MTSVSAAICSCPAKASLPVRGERKTAAGANESTTAVTSPASIAARNWDIAGPGSAADTQFSSGTRLTTAKYIRLTYYHDSYAVIQTSHLPGGARARHPGLCRARHGSPRRADRLRDQA